VSEPVLRSEVEGWGLRVPPDLGGDLLQMSPPAGCTSETCLHNSHDPAAPHYAWRPDEGRQLWELAVEQYPDVRDTYYLLAAPGEHPGRFLVLVEPGHHWARIDELEWTDLPYYVRLRAGAVL
jgi:hypothetical protein